MTGLQGKYTRTSTACLVCAILLGHPMPCAYGFTASWTVARHSPGMLVPDRTVGFPLHSSTLTGPSETKEKIGKKDNKKSPSLASPETPRAQKNKEFLLKRWKKQQAVTTNMKKTAADIKQRDSQSKLVSVVGMSVSSIEDKAKTISRPQKTKTKSKTKTKQSTTKQQSTETEKPKIWNTKVDQQSETTTTSPNTKSKKPKPYKSSSNNGLLPWTSLTPGSIVSGKVVKTLPYGVLVRTNYDIPGKTPGCALLHNHHFLDADDEAESSSVGSLTLQEGTTITKKKKQLLPVGSEVVNARVINLNRDKGTLHISLRPPDKRIVKRVMLQVGDQIEGKVVRLQPYGAFVDVGHKRNALLHISRMSMYKVNMITDHVQVGQTIGVRILRVTDNDVAVSMLSKENDAFVDRRELQAKRMALWQQVVKYASVEDDNDGGEELERVKKDLLEVDRIIWDQFMANDQGARRSVEV
jgi:predicted RNA-binding protein with RPS1 domain